jgi:hypothetical protein
MLFSPWEALDSLSGKDSLTIGTLQESFGKALAHLVRAIRRASILA